jgi:hypothetical protein
MIVEMSFMCVNNVFYNRYEQVKRRYFISEAFQPVEHKIVDTDCKKTSTKKLRTKLIKD